MIHLNLAEQKDFTTIITLAHSIWNSHYVAIIGQKQVDYMLSKFYSLTSLQDQFNEKKHVFYLIEKEEEIIGFVSVSVNAESDFFIQKFYIDQEKSNSGIGSEVLNLLIKIIKPKTLTLNVNRGNFKSINFYFKNGFKIKCIENIDIGDGFFMNDFVMVKSMHVS